MSQIHCHYCVSHLISCERKGKDRREGGAERERHREIDNWRANRRERKRKTEKEKERE